MFSTPHKIVCRIIFWMETSVGIKQVVVPMIFPFEGLIRIVQFVEQEVSAKPHIKLAEFSHIASMPSHIKRIEELNKRCLFHGGDYVGRRCETAWNHRNRFLTKQLWLLLLEHTQMVFPAQRNHFLRHPLSYMVLHRFNPCHLHIFKTKSTEIWQLD